MHRPNRGPLRAVRAAVLAAACAGVAWCGHAVWGAAPAGAWTVPVAGLALFPPLLLFARSHRGLGEIFAVLGGAQVPLHLLFMAGGDSAAVHTADPMHAAHGMHATALIGYDPAMLTGHLWAALLGSALLAHGETALWTLLAVIATALPRLIAPVRSAPEPAGVRPCERSGPVPPHLALLSSDRPRGPPVVSGAH